MRKEDDIAMEKEKYRRTYTALSAMMKDGNVEEELVGEGRKMGKKKHETESEGEDCRLYIYSGKTAPRELMILK